MSSVSATSLSDIPSYESNTSLYAADEGTDEMVADFVTLLTAQLQYQDPLDPMENAEFTSQLAQFSMLNMQQETNDLLSELVSTSDEMTQGVEYIGKTVQVEGDKVPMTDGYGVISFNLSEGANVSVNVYNDNGDLLGTIESQYYDAGDANVTFYDDALGDSLLSYEVVVEDEGSAVTVTQYESGVVDNVVNGDSGVTLEMNGHDVTMDDILRVGA